MKQEKMSELIDLTIGDVKHELEVNTSRKFVRLIIDMFGCIGVVFTAIQEYEARGKYVYPLTHKHYKDLVDWLVFCLKDNKKRELEANKVIYGGSYVKRTIKGKVR